MSHREDELKDILSNYPSFLDTEEMWSRVQDQLEAPRRRRWVFWVIPLLMVSVGSLIFFLSEGDIIDNSSDSLVREEVSDLETQNPGESKIADGQWSATKSSSSRTQELSRTVDDPIKGANPLDDETKELDVQLVVRGSAEPRVQSQNGGFQSVVGTSSDSGVSEGQSELVAWSHREPRKAISGANMVGLTDKERTGSDQLVRHSLISSISRSSTGNWVANKLPGIDVFLDRPIDLPLSAKSVYGYKQLPAKSRLEIFAQVETGRPSYRWYYLSEFNIDDSLFNQTFNVLPSMAYVVGVQWFINARWSLKAGLNYQKFALAIDAIGPYLGRENKYVSFGADLGLSHRWLFHRFLLDASSGVRLSFFNQVDALSPDQSLTDFTDQIDQQYFRFNTAPRMAGWMSLDLGYRFSERTTLRMGWLWRSNLGSVFVTDGAEAQTSTHVINAGVNYRLQ